MPKKGKRAAQKARAAALAEDDDTATETKIPTKGHNNSHTDNNHNEEETGGKKVVGGGARGGKRAGAVSGGSKGEKDETMTTTTAPKKAPKPAQFNELMAEATSSGSGWEFTIKQDDFSLSFVGKSLLEHASITLAFGRRYGLVGINGSGKSTLLRAIATQEILKIPKDVSVLHVEQEVEGDDRTALRFVIEADTERTELFNEQQELEAYFKALKEEEASAEDYDESKEEEAAKKRERLNDVYKKLSAIGAHNAESRANAILTGLQFTEKMKTSPTRELSGGWRMRLSLARALFCRPHLLLLDEPTNHLDLYACIWFEAFLAKWKKTLVIVSHDIDLLNNVCTDIIHVNHHHKTLEHYRGNYDHFVQVRKEKRRKYEKDYENQQKEIKRLRKAAEQKQQVGPKQGRAGERKEKQGTGGRDKKNAAQKNAKTAKEQLEGIVLLAPPERDYKVRFEFSEPGSLPHPVLQVKDASFSYAPPPSADPAAPVPKMRIIFDKINLGIDLDSRVALVGPNGAGKSTLLGMLTGKLEATVGEIIISRKLKMAKFDQHTTEQLDAFLDKSPVEYLQSLFSDMKVDECRKHLGKYGITGKTQINELRTLSGGQKSRVVFAKLALEKPHILMLDEPTNNLDIESIEALCKGLSRFKGGVVLVTHDQNLIAQGCNRIWCIDGDTTVKEFDGDFHQYQKRLVEKLDFSDLEDML
eukprot:TRINITY_DN6241_c0_g1_i1.p1 TRINITY_DN6241_c0_g1~~TRINITY_DN6241_c0_g1_i1.p1  ORF type:complete len:701 (+),score=184.17 TRINITY_DN6241_c0_g1_i1:83-2185(+)